MKNKLLKTMKFFLATLLFLIFLVGVTFVLLLLLRPASNDEYAKNYKPTFKDHSFEMITGDGVDGALLFYKTNSSFAAGEKMKNLKIIEVFKKPDNRGFEINDLDNVIDAIQPSYISFKLDYVNKECFAVYLNGELQNLRIVNIALFPTPSSREFCEGFDFENAFKK